MPGYLYKGESVQLSYSTNVHPARTVADILTYLQEETALVKAQVAPDRPFGITLHVGSAVARELENPALLARLRERLAELAIEVVGINAFPLGDFHAPVVKEQAYAPDWLSRERGVITERIARIFAALAPGGAGNTMSTLAGSYRPWGDDFTVHQAIAENLIATAARLERVAAETGRVIMLGLEPEPCTTLETCDDVLLFFARHVEPAARQHGLGERWRDHLGLNLDLCHQAMLFEDLPNTLDRIAAAGIKIGSVHAAAALCAPSPDAKTLAQLGAFAEPRYLHQVAGRDHDGKIIERAIDLPHFIARASAMAGGSPACDLARLAEVRCHFHVPLADGLVGGLPTTARQTAAAVRHALDRGLTRQIVAETYTWGAGPLAASSQGRLAERIALEMLWLATAASLEQPARP